MRQTLTCLFLLLICDCLVAQSSSQRNEALANALAGGIKVGLDRLFSGPSATKPQSVYYASPRQPELELEVEKVAFAPPEGPCGESLRDMIRADFLDNGLQVVDRSNLDALLAEHELSVSGIVSKEDALELGDILGPMALVFVNARVCDVSQFLERSPGTTSDGRAITHYKATTTGIFRGVVEIVDLRTARVHTAPAIDARRDLSAEQWGDMPPYPSSYDARSAALASAVSQVNKLLFPWTEWLPFAFYSHKKCNLALAHRLMQAKDWTGALSQSLRNVQECRERPRILPYARHNLGVAYFFAGEVDKARNTLNEVLRQDPTDATTAALVALQKAGQEKAVPIEQAPAREVIPTRSDVTDRLEELRGLWKEELISDEIYRTKVNSAIIEDGPPGTTSEEKLRNLKALKEQGLITEEVYKQKVAEVLAAI